MLKLNIKKLLKNNNKTIYWLHKELGISYIGTKKLVNGKVEIINFEDIEKLCTLFSCTPNELFTFAKKTESKKVIL